MTDNVYTPKSTANYINPGSQPAGSIADAVIPRTLPRQIATGSTRGTQTVGYGSVKIDGTSNSIILSSPVTGNSNVTISANGYQLFTNPSTQINQIIIGVLPDNTYGLVISKPGVDVLTVFS